LAEDQQRVRWGLVIAITLVGCVFVAAPFLLAAWDGKYGTIPGVASGTLTNIGTSIVLVGIVFFLERGFVKRVTAAAAQSTVRLVEERTAELKTANEELATELADLRAEFHRVVESESEEQTAALRNVATDVSFDSVSKALEAANDFGALVGGVVTVPMKAPVDQPELVTFEWGYHKLRGQDGMPNDQSVPAIAVRYRPIRNPGGGFGMPVVEVLWMPGEAPTKLLVKLRSEMIRLGFGAEAKEVDADVLEHVGRALGDAVAGRRADDGAWVTGQLSTWLAEGWAVTDAGLISRDHGSIASADFPKTDVLSPSEPFDPPTPEGVSEAFWRFAVDCAQRAHGHGATSVALRLYADRHRPRPFTSDTSPRGK